MPSDLSPIHPELRGLWQKFPRISFNHWSVRPIQALTRLLPGSKSPGVTVEQGYAQAGDGSRTVRLRVYRPAQAAAPGPALLWIHGGGYVIGSPQQDERVMFEFVHALRLVVVSVDYRLAPQHPFPAPLDDCYTALLWIHRRAGELGIDPQRIAIGGSSAGGGLAAGLAQLALDRGEVRPAFQLLVYPMLDDRTALHSDVPYADLLTWDQKSNYFGWKSYLHHEPGLENAPPYAVPARREDLRGLPPAWIGVGTLDLFHDEDVAYAQRLAASGTPCELVVVPGAFHGFEVFGAALPVVRDFRQSQIAALRTGLGC